MPFSSFHSVNYSKAFNQCHLTTALTATMQDNLKMFRFASLFASLCFYVGKEVCLRTYVFSRLIFRKYILNITYFCKKKNTTVLTLQ